MNPSTRKTAKLLVVESEVSRFEELAAAVPECRWESVREERLDSGAAVSFGDAPDAVIVDISRADDSDGLRRCRAVRERIDAECVPLFALISRYQIHIGNQVKQLPNSDFILQPPPMIDLFEKLRGCCACGDGK